MPAKLVVTPDKTGTRIDLVGVSGRPLMHAGPFADARAKGATLRALTGLMGEKVTVEDQTTVRARRKPAG